MTDKTKKGVSERKDKVFELLHDPRNWKPDLGEISIKAKIPLSTTHDIIKRIWKTHRLAYVDITRK